MGAPSRQIAARRARVAGMLLVALLLAGPLLAYVRLRTSAGVPLHWDGAQLPLTFVVQAAGSDDVPDAADDLAVRRAFGAWDDQPGSYLDLFEIATPEARARTDWWADDLHLVLFDEADATGWFPEGSGIVAVTPLQYLVGSGDLIDGDILLNGRETFAAGTVPGAYDIRTVVTHEVGHLVGLGHSPLVGSTMAPYVEQAQFSPRSLSTDDVAGLDAAYPLGTAGTLRGAVEDGNGEPVVGAHVWARGADGRTRVGGLTDLDGRYTLTGLPAGDYRVSAQPVDFPLPKSKFLGGGLTIGDFDTAFQPATTAPVSLAQGALAQVPDLVVPPDANFKVKGPFTARMLHRGESRILELQVEAWLGPGALEVPGAGGAVTLGSADFTPPGKLALPVTVAADAPLGLYDLSLVSELGERCLLPGFLEVLPPAPLVTGALPPCAGSSGGSILQLDGAGFTADAELAFGDAPATSVVVVDQGQLMAEAPPHGTGAVDLVVTTSGGEEARLPAGFQYVAGTKPSLFAVFPWAGSQVGGTPVALLGAGFDANTTVTVGGVPAPVEAVPDPGELRIRTPPLPPGVHAVTVTHPGCAALTATLPAAFTALAFADPLLDEVAPDTVSADGGDVLQIFGAHFQQGAVVELFTDLTDGSGGTQVPAQWVNAGHLRCTTPPGPLGRASLLVRNPDGGTAALEEAVELVPSLAGKDVVKGTIEPDGVQVALLDGLEGTELTVLVERLHGTSLLTALTVYGPDGDVTATADPNVPGYDPELVALGGKRLRLGPFVLPVTGRYVLELSGLSGTSGDYRLRLRERVPKELLKVNLPKKAPAAAGPGEQAVMEVMAKPGSILKGVLKAKGGLQIQLVGFHGPDGKLLAEEGDTGLEGDPLVLPAIDLNALRRKLKMKGVPLDTLGTYVLTIGAMPGTSGPLVGKLKVKVPKSKELYEP